MRESLAQVNRDWQTRFALGKNRTCWFQRISVYARFTIKWRFFHVWNSLTMIHAKGLLTEVKIGQRFFPLFLLMPTVTFTCDNILHSPFKNETLIVETKCANGGTQQAIDWKASDSTNKTTWLQYAYCETAKSRFYFAIVGKWPHIIDACKKKKVCGQKDAKLAFGLAKKCKFQANDHALGRCIPQVTVTLQWLRVL